MPVKDVNEALNLVKSVIALVGSAFAVGFAYRGVQSTFAQKWDQKYVDFKFLRDEVIDEHLHASCSPASTQKAESILPSTPEMRLATWVLHNCHESQTCKEKREMCRKIDHVRSNGRSMLQLFQSVDTYLGFPGVKALFVGRQTNEAANVLSCVGPLDAVNRYRRTASGKPHFALIKKRLQTEPSFFDWRLVLFTLVAGHDEPNLVLLDLFQKYPEAFPKNFELSDKIDKAFSLIPELRSMGVDDAKIKEFDAWLTKRKKE